MFAHRVRGTENIAKIFRRGPLAQVAIGSKDAQEVLFYTTKGVI